MKGQIKQPDKFTYQSLGNVKKRELASETKVRGASMTGSSHFFTSVTFQSPAISTCFLFTDNLYNIFYHSVLDTVERLLPKAWNTLKIVYHLQSFLLLGCTIRWLSLHRQWDLFFFGKAQLRWTMNDNR